MNKKNYLLFIFFCLHVYSQVWAMASKSDFSGPKRPSSQEAQYAEQEVPYAEAVSDKLSSETQDEVIRLYKELAFRIQGNRPETVTLPLREKATQLEWQRARNVLNYWLNFLESGQDALDLSSSDKDRLKMNELFALIAERAKWSRKQLRNPSVQERLKEIYSRIGLTYGYTAVGLGSLQLLSLVGLLGCNGQVCPDGTMFVIGNHNNSCSSQETLVGPVLPTCADTFGIIEGAIAGAYLVLPHLTILAYSTGKWATEEARQIWNWNKLDDFNKQIFKISGELMDELPLPNLNLLLILIDRNIHSAERDPIELSL